MERTFRRALVLALSAWMAISLVTPSAAVMTFVDCLKKDEAMLKRQARKFADADKKTKKINMDALAKDPEKFCKWMKEFSLPIKDQWRRELETRLAGECRRDPLMLNQFVSAYHYVMVTKRQIDSVCSGVEEY